MEYLLAPVMISSHILTLDDNSSSRCSFFRPNSKIFQNIKKMIIIGNQLHHLHSSPMDLLVGGAPVFQLSEHK